MWIRHDALYRWLVVPGNSRATRINQPKGVPVLLIPAVFVLAIARCLTKSGKLSSVEHGGTLSLDHCYLWFICDTELLCFSFKCPRRYSSYVVVFHGLTRFYQLLGPTTDLMPLCLRPYLEHVRSWIDKDLCSFRNLFIRVCITCLRLHFSVVRVYRLCLRC
jgi:hypothetical protein